MDINAICHYLQNLPWSVDIRQSTLMFPIIEGTHVLALSISIGLVLILDLRFLRIGFRGEAVSRVMGQIGPWMITGLAIMFVTGILLFIAQAEKAWGSVFFRVKLILLVLAGINALYYQLKFFPNMAAWDQAARVPFGVRLCALFSLVLWIGVIVCGRTMAYEI